MSTPQHHKPLPPAPPAVPPPAVLTTARGTGQDDALETSAGIPQSNTEQQGKKSAFNSDRPLGVAPVPEGGVAIGGQPGLPEGRANLGDKIIGKTQKVVGKYTNNPELHEKGELRETGGKEAAEGRARAAHD